MFEQVLAAYEGRKLTGSDQLLYAHALEGYSQLLSRIGEPERAARYAESAVMLLDDTDTTPSIHHGWIALKTTTIRLRYTYEQFGSGKKRASVAPL